MIRVNFKNKLKELMVLCWDEDPTKRPSFEQIIKLLHHPEVLALD